MKEGMDVYQIYEISKKQHKGFYKYFRLLFLLHERLFRTNKVFFVLFLIVDLTIIYFLLKYAYQFHYSEVNQE